MERLHEAADWLRHGSGPRPSSALLVHPRTALRL